MACSRWLKLPHRLHSLRRTSVSSRLEERRQKNHAELVWFFSFYLSAFELELTLRFCGAARCLLLPARYCQGGFWCRHVWKGGENVAGEKKFVPASFDAACVAHFGGSLRAGVFLEPVPLGRSLSALCTCKCARGAGGPLWIPHGGANKSVA